MHVVILLCYFLVKRKYLTYMENNNYMHYCYFFLLQWPKALRSSFTKHVPHVPLNMEKRNPFRSLPISVHNKFSYFA